VIIAVDFDGTVVKQNRPYGDLESPLELEDGAREGLEALKRAGHVLLLFSARANLALRLDPDMDPLVRAGVRRVDRARWERMRPVHVARYEQMLVFVAAEFPGIFDAVDDGIQGKPSADLFVDDRALRFGQGALGLGWAGIANAWGEPDFGTPIGGKTP
jgi:hypothetical protein